jgi:hypothetical protein
MTDVRNPRLELAPLTLREANAYVERHHRYVERHHRHSVPVAGAKFALAAALAGEVVGVAIVGRPVARGLDDGWTLEVLRVCTRGARNACSFLYGRAWRAARALGYRRLVTYTRADELGTSLTAAGWRVVGEVTARSWDTPSRPRVDRDERQDRLRWEPAA